MSIDKHIHVNHFINLMKRKYSKELDISRLGLDSLPEEILEAKEIEEIDLSWNDFTEFPNELFDLPNLKSIKINSNFITEIPKGILRLQNLQYVNFEDNLLVQPPIEVVSRGIEAIRDYFELLESEEIVRLFEAKLLIVGQGNVGKTCLIKKLMDPSINIDEEEITTEGIKIYQWNVNTQKYDNIRLNFWDFGGQEIYHSTHQFFLTKRSLYLFAWEVRKDEINFDYWLNVVKLLSKNSPLLVIQTKSDSRIKNIDEAVLIEKFPNIVGFYKVSAKTGSGISELIQNIKNEVSNLAHLGDKLPKVWIDIREKLESLQEDYIEYTTYLNICNSSGLNKERADFLSQYFHDLGVFLHFQDNSLLKNILFLRPAWATDAVYKLLDSRSVQIESGKFHFDQLSKIWYEYPEEKYIYLLELMKKFELCFQIDNSKTYIVPELLKPSQVENYTWDSNYNFIFEYRYQFMPSGILTRFIVRNHDLIEKDLYWQTGVILRREKTRAMIVSNQLERSIRIKIVGEQKKALLSVIRRDIEKIHESLNHPLVDEMIMCRCQECINSLNPYFHNYRNIQKAIAKLKTHIECQHSFESVPIDILLGDYEKLENNISTALNVYGNYYDNSMHVSQGNGYKIEKGNLNIINKQYDPKLNISQDDFEKFKLFLNSIPQQTLNDLVENLSNICNESNPTNDETAFNKIRDIIKSNGYAIAQGLSTSALFEVLKYLLL